MESSAPPPEPPLPTPPKATADVLLGKYELGRLLGRGSFAKVYQATSLSTKTTVAIKVLDKTGLLTGGASPDMVLREVTAMRRLRHPNILRLHEVLATRSKIYLVMDHAAGGDLLSRLARRPGSRLPEAAARRYFQQLAAALRFCHARGVHHRDVKPQNLLLLDRRGDHLALADFGLSALPDQLCPAGLLRTACGTPAFAAPELSRRRPYDGAKADAWSCGVILFVLLSGSLPFDDRNLALMYRKMSQRDYRFPPRFPPAGRTVISRLLDPDPETRFTIDRAMELPWFRRAYSLDHRLDLLGALPPPAAEEEKESTIDGENHHHPLASSMNAFDIISLSAGLDLSGLFDEGAKGGRRRFSSTEKVERVMERIEEVVGGKFGYSVKRRKGGVLVGLGRWGSVVSVEVAEVTPPLLLVELRVEDGGGGGKVGEEFCWKELRSELDDIVFAWHSGIGVDV